jgi:DNA-binding IclR family transcriptional regulator
MAGNVQDRGQSVAGRLLRVLEAFTPERPHLTIVEISRRTGIPPSTLYRLVAELLSRGAVERSADGRYSVGLRLWEIGGLAPRPARLIDVGSPHMHDLFEVIHGTVQLAILAGGDALYVQTVGGHGPPPAPALTGTRVSLTSTTIGQVLLAYAPPDVLEKVLANEVRSTVDDTVVPPQRLRALLADVRRTGARVFHGHGGRLVVAVPVDGVAAALAVRAPDGAEPRFIVPLVRRAARRISRDLPCPPLAVGDGNCGCRSSGVLAGSKVDLPPSEDGTGAMDRRRVIVGRRSIRPKRSDEEVGCDSRTTRSPGAASSATPRA